MAITDSGVGLQYSTAVATAPDLSFLIGDFMSNYMRDARNNANPILALVPDRKRKISGKFFVEPVRFGRNPRAFGGVREGGKFPEPGTHKSRIMSLKTRTQMMRFKMDGFMIRANEGEATRSIDLVADHISRTLEDFEIDEGRMMHSDGSGRIGEMAGAGGSWAAVLLAKGVTAVSNTIAAGASGTITVSPNSDIATGQGSSGATVAGCPDMPGTMYFDVGGRYAVCDENVANSPVLAVIRVDAIVDDYTLTVTNIGTTALTTGGGANQWADGDWIVKIGNDDSTVAIADSAYRREPMGLGGIFGRLGVLDGNGPAMEVGMTAPDTELAGYNATTWSGTEQYSPTVTGFATASKYWFQGMPANASALASGVLGELTFNQGITFNNAGVPRKPTEALLQRALTAIKRVNNASPTFYLSAPEERDTYFETLLAEKRYLSKKEMKGGWDVEAGGPGGLPWVADIRCWRNRVYLPALEDGDFEHLVYAEMDWASFKGSPIWTPMLETDEYQARMIGEWNYKIGVRNQCGGVVLDIQSS